MHFCIRWDQRANKHIVLLKGYFFSTFSFFQSSYKVPLFWGRISALREKQLNRRAIFYISLLWTSVFFQLEDMKRFLSRCKTIKVLETIETLSSLIFHGAEFRILSIALFVPGLQLVAQKYSMTFHHGFTVFSCLNLNLFRNIIQEYGFFMI